MMSFRLGLILVTFFILGAYGSAKVENGHVSVWDSVIREKREATADKETVKVDCKIAQDLDIKCKEDSCPLDDKTVDTCCQCVETCCSSQQAPEEPNTESPSNSTSTSTDQAKKKVNDTVSKVEGFLINVGKDIKSVVTKGWDKVKSTTKSVEESARKGINQGAAWVHNKTDSEPSAGNKSELCKDKRLGAISTTPTHVNGTFIDMNCTTDLGIKPLDDEISSESPDAQPKTTAKPTKKTKRSAANNEKSNVDKGQSKSDSPGQTEPTSPSPTKKNKRNTDFPSGKGPILEMKVNITKSNTRSNTASDSSDSMEVQSTTEKKPVTGMRRNKRQVQSSHHGESMNSNGNRQNWSSSSSSSTGQTPGANQGTGNHNMGGETDGSSYTSSQMTSSSNSNMGGNGANRGTTTVSKENQYRQRRDIPPGMVAKKLANEDVNPTTSQGETPQRSSRYTAHAMDTATTTMKSMSSMNDKDESKDRPSGQNRNKREAAPPSTMSPPPANNSSLLAPKSKKEAPSAMMTTASPINSTSRSKRQAPPPPSSTMNPMSSTSKTPLKSKRGAPTSIMTTMSPLNNSTMTQQRSKSEALSPPSVTAPNPPCSSRSRRAAAGPPVYSQSKQTTPMPAGGPPCPDDKKSRKRRAFYRKQKTAAPATTTFDPLEDSDSSTTEETYTQPPRRDTSRRDSTTKPRRDKDNNVWITVSASAAKPRDKIPNRESHAQVPIRAPGSVDPEDILDMPISNQNDGDGGERGRRPLQSGFGNSNYDRDSINHGGTGSRGSNGGSGNSVLRPLPPAGLSTSSSSEDNSPILSNPDPSVPKLKPGQCRPLSHGLQCVSLGRDAAQCKDDSGCQETKKCCFYSCTPNQDIGVCEHPIFS